MAETLTQLRRQTSSVVRPAIHAGKTVIITEHGKPVLKISPDCERVRVSAEEMRLADISDEAIREAVHAARE